MGFLFLFADVCSQMSYNEVCEDQNVVACVAFDFCALQPVKSDQEANDVYPGMKNGIYLLTIYVVSSLYSSFHFV